MKISSQSRWPDFSQKLVLWLVKIVAKEDVKELRSHLVAKELQIKTLWCTGMRVLREYGPTKVQVDLQHDSPEWADLRDALNSVHINRVIPSSENREQ